MVIQGMSIVSALSGELRKQIQSVQSPILDDYDAMNGAPGFGDLPSVLPGTAKSQELAGSWHYFLYVPKSFSPDRETPILVFLHGFGGNFKVYGWWWKDLCEQNGWVMVLPTFGMGFWTNPGSGELVKGSVRHARQVTGSKEGPVFLLGLSNGAPGVAYVAGKGAPHDGLIFISGGAPDLRVLPRSDTTPVLMLVGKEDWAYASADATRRAFLRRRVGVTFKTYPGQGHFLLALERERVSRDIAGWIKRRLGELGARL